MRAAILGAVAALALPASAAAATQYYIPPNNSGGNQYVESVPTAGGSSPTSSISHPGKGGSGTNHALSRGTESALLAQGPDGARVAAFANQTAPGGRGGAAGARTGGGGATGNGATSGGGGSPGASSNGESVGSGGSSPAISVARSITGLGGHGGFGVLPIVLIAVTIGIGGLALLRRRRVA
jgi:hypothetical protein